ncbi:MAG: DNA-3-methyladenine glycosylase [Chloroflexi bacterium]|nr:DNA-3-methyladenine glycosylase [Chloroflexota bacterium]
MIAPIVLPRAFYNRRATLVARDLLGAILVHPFAGQRLSGRIVETEAYTGHDDLASHGRQKRTPRNFPMWGDPGHAYVYLIYGRYWLLNVVCEPAGHPAAVLIRAVEPLDGEDVMAANRAGRPRREWTSGPGRLALALDITGEHNSLDLTRTESGLWIEAGEPVPDGVVCTGPRIGMGPRVLEPWFSMPWRWWVGGNPYVSRKGLATCK